MKKLLFIWIAVVLLFPLPSCDKIDAEYDFDSVYTIIMDASMQLHKYNILTGSMTSLCPDPVCDHTKNTDCMFVSASMVQRVKSGVCFVKDGQIFEDPATGSMMLPQSIVWYDYNRGAVDVLCTINGTKYEGLQGRLIPDDKYVYYSVRAADDTKEVFELWRVKTKGGVPENMGITTGWVTSGIVDGWAWYADVTGIYRIHLQDKTVEYLLENPGGVTTAIYFFDENGGAYCVQQGSADSVVVYIRAGEEPLKVMEGVQILYLQLSGDVLCYSEGNNLYAITLHGQEKKLLYTADGNETLNGLWSCGMGFTARYVDYTAETERFVPLILREK